MLIEGAFIHHVFFWLKSPGDPRDRDELIAGLQKLARLPLISGFHIGVPADTRREVIDSGYSVSWLVIFTDASGQESYQDDPLHLEFVKNCSHLWNKVLVYDSEQAPVTH